MSADRPAPGPLQVAINRGALALAVLLFAAIVVVAVRERARTYETPRWDPARFARLRPADAPHDTMWMVMVNPDCLHCRARLADLLRRDAARRSDAALGVLLIDTPRPDSLELPARFPAGVWWDSTQVWRRRWGHRTYGEVLVFGPGGALARTVPPDADPGAPPAR